MAAKLELVRKKLGLSPALGQVAWLLIEQDIVSSSDVEAICRAPRESIYRVRNALRAHGVEIKSGRRLGWWLSDEDRAMLREECDGVAG